MPKHSCSCGARYSFPESAAGKRAKCKKCGEVFTLPEAEAEAEGIFAIAGEESAFAAEAAAAASASKNKAEEYARAAILAQSRGVGQTVLETSDADPTPLPVHSRGYAASIADSFLFITSLGNLIIFLFIWFLISGLRLAPFAGIVAMVFYVFILMWYSAYRFQIVSGAAAGDRNLPELEMSREELFDYFWDAIRWVLSWVVVMAPAIAYLSYLLSTGIVTPFDAARMSSSGWDKLLTFYVDYPVFVLLTVGGSMLWPMAILCLALGGWNAMMRIDLMIATILRAPGGYLATVAFWGGAVALSVAGEWAIDQMNAGGGGGFGPHLMALVLKDGLAIYTGIVALRVIGLYYHHFKDRFAWDWG